jgi:hypothetical protein
VISEWRLGSACKIGAFHALIGADNARYMAVARIVGCSLNPDVRASPRGRNPC